MSVSLSILLVAVYTHIAMLLFGVVFTVDALAQREDVGIEATGMTTPVTVVALLWPLFAVVLAIGVVYDKYRSRATDTQT